MSDPVARVRHWSPALHRLLHAAAGGLLLLAGLAVGALPGIAVHWRAFRAPLLGAGAILILVGGLRADRRVARISRGCCLVSAAAVLTLAAIELGFRAARFDFRRQAARLQQMPPFYRKPTIPTGTVFYRREGPLEWHGPVIRRMLDCVGLDSGAYAAEPAITVRYDALGFRNEPRPAAWELAVAGDSFTELGHLPFDELFTTRLAAALDIRVLNLGVGNTGPLTQLSYLRDYGLSPATRQVLIVFFEGNDLEDLVFERAAEQQFEATGRRGFRTVRSQTSFLRAVGEQVRSRTSHSPPADPPVEGYLKLANRRLPVTVGTAPGGWTELPPATRAALERFCAQFSDFARDHGVRAWLAYMPCKRRVWHGHLEFAAAAAETVRGWEPSDLPAVLNGLCATHAIRFLDLTPALVAGLRGAGEPGYNLLYDSHLNARGSRAVAEVLSAALRSDRDAATGSAPHEGREAGEGGNPPR